jgi:hypothetical protein
MSTIGGDTGSDTYDNIGKDSRHPGSRNDIRLQRVNNKVRLAIEKNTARDLCILRLSVKQRG